MATEPDFDRLNLDEQLARISKLVEDTVKSRAETRNIVADTKIMPIATVFQGLIAIGALLGAGAALAKLFFP